jgi:apolipoprotein N-acyltransferase
MIAKIAALPARVAVLPPRRRALVGLGLGAAIATGQSPLGLAALAVAALLIAFAVFSWIDRAKTAAWFGWFTGTGYFAATLFWIVEPFFVDPERHGWIAPFALFFMAGGLALFWAAAFGTAARMARPRSTRLMALALTLTLAELTRAYVLTGFPWAMLSYIWIGFPVIQSVAFIGPHGLTLAMLALIALPQAMRNRRIGAGLSLLVLAAVWMAGVFLLAVPDIPRQNPVNLRLVQPNAPQNQKWDPELAPVFFQRQLDLSGAPSDIAPDLVIWPESSLTFWFGDEPATQQQIVDAAPPAAKMIIGAQRYEGRRYFNAMVLMGADGSADKIYDKEQLVPFGEYVPFGWMFSRIGINGLAAEEGGGFSPGSGPRLMDLGRLGVIRPLICYESIFPNLVRATSPRPDWILLITNDAWFGDLAGPHQHLAQARVRAIELGLPFVRAANTGISAVIDSRGRILDHLPLGVAGKLDAALPGSLPPTIYSKTGDWPILFVVVLGLAIVTYRRKYS